MPAQLRHVINRRARRCAKYAKAAWKRPLGVFRPGNVAMFHVGRVGSSVLARMLSQHRRVYWAGEVFEKEHGRYMKAVASGSYTLPQDPQKILRTEMHAAGHQMFGFETKFLNEHHLKVIGLDLESYIDLLFRLGFDHYVVLTRRNILRRLVSGVVMRKTGRSHIPATEDRREIKIHLDVQQIPIGAKFYSIVDAIQLIEDGHEHLSRALADKNVFELNYENHISDDPFVAYRKMMAFMGMEPGEPNIPFRKTNPDPLKELIENYDELQAVLEDTPYRWMVAG